MEQKNSFTTPKGQTVQSVSYCKGDKLLTVEMKDGSLHRYAEVPHRLWKVFELYTECEGNPDEFYKNYIKDQFICEVTLA